MQQDWTVVWCNCCLAVCSTDPACFHTREVAVELGALGCAVDKS